MTGLTVYNQLIGIIAGIITTFLIPWVNKKLHVSIPDNPQTEQEIELALEHFLKKPSPAAPPPVTDLGSNPFTSSPSPAPSKVTPPENGAK